MAYLLFHSTPSQKPPRQCRPENQMLNSKLIKVTKHGHPTQRAPSASPICVRRADVIITEFGHLFEIKQQLSKPAVPFLHSTLGHLPPEIRAQIYVEVLTLPTQTKQRHRSILVTKNGNASSRLALLATCRQIYIEALHVFYARNTLHLANDTDLLDFLTAIGPARRANIASLHLENLLESFPTFDKRWLAGYCDRENISGDTRRFLESCKSDRLSTAAQKAAAIMHTGSSSLRLQNLQFELKRGQELTYLSFLRQLPGFVYARVDFITSGEWDVYPSSERNTWYKTLLQRMTKGKENGPFLRGESRGTMHSLKLNILPSDQTEASGRPVLSSQEGGAIYPRSKQRSKCGKVKESADYPSGLEPVTQKAQNLSNICAKLKVTRLS